MSKKISGLGRGLGELLDDNAPEVRTSGTVIRHDGTGDVSISPEAVEKTEIIHTLSTDYRSPRVHVAVTPINAGRSYDAPLTAEEILGYNESGEDRNVSEDRELNTEKVETVEIKAKNAEIQEEKSEIQAENPENVDGSTKEEPRVEAPRRSLKALFREYGR